MLSPKTKFVGISLVILILVSFFTLIGSSLFKMSLNGDPAMAWPWSPYAKVMIGVGPFSVGAHAYVYLYDGNGKYYGCLKTPGTWGANWVTFNNVFVDKQLTIYVRYQTGELKRYTVPGTRPYLDTLKITIDYFNGVTGVSRFY